MAAFRLVLIAALVWSVASGMGGDCVIDMTVAVEEDPSPPTGYVCLYVRLHENNCGASHTVIRLPAPCTLDGVVVDHGTRPDCVQGWDTGASPCGTCAALHNTTTTFKVNLFDSNGTCDDAQTVRVCLPIASGASVVDVDAAHRALVVCAKKGSSSCAILPHDVPGGDDRSGDGDGSDSEDNGAEPTFWCGAPSPPPPPPPSTTCEGNKCVINRALNFNNTDIWACNGTNLCEALRPPTSFILSETLSSISVEFGLIVVRTCPTGTIVGRCNVQCKTGHALHRSDVLVDEDGAQYCYGQCIDSGWIAGAPESVSVTCVRGVLAVSPP